LCSIAPTVPGDAEGAPLEGGADGFADELGAVEVEGLEPEQAATASAATRSAAERR
jgi:hypothetical protein